MMWAPSWAATWAAYAETSRAVSPSLLRSEPPGVRPDDDHQAVALGLLAQGLELLVHLHPRSRAGVDGVADGGAAEAQGRLHGAGDGLQGVGVGGQVLAVVELEDQGQVAGVVAGPGLEEAEGRGVGVEAGFEGQLEVIAGVEGGRVGHEGTGGTVLHALVDGQDDQPPAAAEPALVEEAGEVGQGAGVVASVPAQDLADSGLHGRVSQVDGCRFNKLRAGGPTRHPAAGLEVRPGRSRIPGAHCWPVRALSTRTTARGSSAAAARGRRGRSPRRGPPRRRRRRCAARRGG